MLTDGDGVVAVAIDSPSLEPLFNEFVPGDDPFYLVHTRQPELFVGVELDTVFGNGLTGELGTFPTDCATHGICVHLDPDGVGPLVGGGPGEGTITVEQIDGEALVTIDDVEIIADDGTVYRMTPGG